MRKDLIWYVLLSLIYSIIFYISWIIWIIDFTISLIFYCIIFFFIYSIWKFLRKKERNDFIEFWKYFIYKISTFIVFISAILYSFAYYNNIVNPAKMPRITISNWEKEVIFQAMSHIAKPSFYEWVKNSIIEYKTNSWVLFFEWVKKWTKENTTKFDEALWVNFTPELYKNMSKLYGVTFQDNESLLWIVNNLDFNVDLNLDEIIKLYEKKIWQNKKSNTIINNDVVNVSDEIMKKLSELNEKELKVLVYLNQAILNVIIKNEDKARELVKNAWNTDLFSIILDERNKNLSENIIKSNYQKIFITYWLMHFNWVFELLKNNDKNWQIKKIEYLYPISW